MDIGLGRTDSGGTGTRTDNPAGQVHHLNSCVAARYPQVRLSSDYPQIDVGREFRRREHATIAWWNQLNGHLHCWVVSPPVARFSMLARRRTRFVARY